MTTSDTFVNIGSISSIVADDPFESDENQARIKAAIARPDSIPGREHELLDDKN